MQYLNWYEIMTGDVQQPRSVEQPRVRSEFEVDFAIWKDMVEEPSKYGDDIIEWLELNEKLTKGAGRWRLAAYWLQIEREQEKEETESRAVWREAFAPIAKQAAMECGRRWVKRDIAALKRKVYLATTGFQALVRGHQARSRAQFRDCCMCLSHVISPLKTDVGFMCRACAEQGPYDEETGPIADPWSEFRADFVDPQAPRKAKVEMCRYCESSIPAGQGFCDTICRNYHAEEAEFGVGFDTKLPPKVPHPIQCHWCFAELEDEQLETGYRFCDRDCEYAYMKEAWRESRY